MGIVTPPRGSRGAAPFANKGPVGGVASGGVAPHQGHPASGRKPLMNGGSFTPGGAYGSAAAGPYDPTLHKQSTRSSTPPLH